MEVIYQYAWLIPVLPLLGAMLVGLGLISINQVTNRLRQLNAVVIISLMGASMVLSSALLWSQIQGHAPYLQTLEWAAAGNFHLTMGYTIDHLTALMLVIVTTVAVLVMIYTDGYMAHDPGYVRFYAYLSLFGSSMLGLVVSPNLVQVYIFWELVGMCSYLLVGFWYDRKAAADACQKAFVTNRVGDFGLLLGILGLFWATGSFDFMVMGDRLSNLVETGSISNFLAIVLAILVFLGPVAKSAQFPLHVWLPDAMEGPTPISALIHAATMVAAGVFLIARMYPVFENVPAAMNVIAYTGAFTAFLGATIAITQNDIKKGLAYSTISQLGYMVMAMGVGAYSAGLFHLMTHAYFKAMLFLGSGSVIHGMEAVVGHDPVLAQDMRLMGGLRKYMPVTGFTFLIGCLAIAGIPPFAGFWSKDEILGAAFAANPFLWFIGWLTAGITAFYMFRMYFSTFEGKFRGNDEKIKVKLKNAAAALAQRSDTAELTPNFGPGAMKKGELSSHSHDSHSHEPHESPWTMSLPLVVLAVPSMLIGLVGTPYANYFEQFIFPPSETLAEVMEKAAEFDPHEFYVMAGSSVAVSVVGITLAVLMYLARKIDPSAIASKIQPLYDLSLNKWYFDDIYHRVFVLGLRRVARQVMEVDFRVVDGAVNLTGFFTLVSGEGLKYLETGRVQFYALIVFGAVLGLVIVFGVT
ncbi:MAG: NAD(P)H-quinone oxidoreductase subunit 5 [Anabaena sp. CoA2_C59]|jgi:NAD(P)H-quinone oxidoreductase subunit 5|uniref:NAD(P)H-quinone oxidoreductase subunit 5 n=1 Tax=Aphanizomenon flos-aquae FACHB-1249 TaxID=2692889 RepID=A0ABR8IVB1_APHFL|nr:MULTISPECIES: NAD(P)H-quinone oxidoreductase subunit 5 [Aphanizomenon]MCE2904894.1 NAD(P)H-quinone oxidoreductase subunit 5 [Anabaena sp. CoA2_C59]MDJ0503704.1 NAD(P)H-quinone oxidoreductase subunit 5 [Nostocales cyanobacterium LE14-WE12]MBD2389169.1 NAD(P)H-quinone oxidoreductase subunit 5 [Aphanizomenon flos-aquae FACHB-1171]MBD2556263.1 NAD(P)H-quinone oxidoreductase subunit 5 [Aphanizomenon flos-aquae FACHB-1290]MBD2632766.1 NAD(P)H-quinone oxidoreductase subunit 5 [Aphanizomenon sp. FA